MIKYIAVLPFFLLSACAVVCADTIYLRDTQQEVKGVVVEEYHDRVVLSAEGGEVTYFRNNIAKIDYDTAEDNLAKLGAYYKDKGDYTAALYCYQAAHKLNPTMKEAREGTLLVNNLIFREREADLEKQVTLRQDIENNARKIGGAQSGRTVVSLEAKRQELLHKVGIAIETAGPDIKVTRVLARSAASDAGILARDTMVAIWGKLIRYMQLKDVYQLFLGSGMSELRVVVSRDIPLALKEGNALASAGELMGGEIAMELEGLTVRQASPNGPAAKAGIAAGDRIAAIGGMPTRYMPLDEACALLKKNNGRTVRVRIEKELVLWKK